uniref:60S ribosomal protein L6 n=1 Tax=Lotus japonicus TaxID=34305 RepID=I3S9E9_LOTJA|nr:unknown [Lotus japonicus]
MPLDVTNRRPKTIATSKKGTSNKIKAKEAVPLKKQGEPRWYSADDVPRAIPSRKSHAKPTRLRSSITPGTVLIVLAGRFRGKRVVFLKQLASGLLLVTGPYKINGVPIRRLNQAYVIATSTKIDVSSVDVKSIDDKFFAKAKEAPKKKKDGEEFFEQKEEKKVISDARKKEQSRVDGALLPLIKKVPQLYHYLNAKFTLTNGVYPHAIKF